jgi:hypothetical protein
MPPASEHAEAKKSAIRRVIASLTIIVLCQVADGIKRRNVEYFPDGVIGSDLIPLDRADGRTCEVAPGSDSASHIEIKEDSVGPAWVSGQIAIHRVVRWQR